jgi:putative Mn2+ efflux pump MntP
MQGAVNIATGILILMHRKSAILLSGICAALFTIACIVHGLSLVDTVSVVLVWIGFSWYRSWCAHVTAPGPMPSI